MTCRRTASRSPLNLLFFRSLRSDVQWKLNIAKEFAAVLVVIRMLLVVIAATLGTGETRWRSEVVARSVNAVVTLTFVTHWVVISRLASVWGVSTMLLASTVSVVWTGTTETPSPSRTASVRHRSLVVLTWLGLSPGSSELISMKGLKVQVFDV